MKLNKSLKKNQNKVAFFSRMEFKIMKMNTISKNTKVTFWCMLIHF